MMNNADAVVLPGVAPAKEQLMKRMNALFLHSDFSRLPQWCCAMHSKTAVGGSCLASLFPGCWVQLRAFSKAGAFRSGEGIWSVIAARMVRSQAESN